MNRYEKIADIIRYLDDSFLEQPSLESLAKRSGMSPFHFHRLFSSWVGVTPKDFVQSLTLAHVKKLLKTGASVLDATLDSGLSSPGRLHDLCINLEAVTPGELKSRGKGLIISAGFADTPFGICLIGKTSRGICHLSFVNSKSKNEFKYIKRNWPEAEIRRSDTSIKKIAVQIFNRNVGSKKQAALNAYVRGTKFQVSVWRALLKVKPGTLVTYQDLAKKIKNPKAVRAVGTAVGDNFIAYLIPCHRVIRSTGVIGNYRWGGVRKRTMLGWEFSKNDT